MTEDAVSRSGKHRRVRSVAAILLLAAGIAGCAEKLPEGEADAAISSRVRAAFSESGVVPGYAMRVRTQDGVVWLSGYARNDAQKNQVGVIAASADGVKDVENHLEIMPPPGDAPWPRGR
jgi:osmotically-inducible protein OsmY